MKLFANRHPNDWLESLIGSAQRTNSAGVLALIRFPLGLGLILLTVW